MEVGVGVVVAVSERVLHCTDCENARVWWCECVRGCGWLIGWLATSCVLLSGRAELGLEMRLWCDVIVCPHVGGSRWCGEVDRVRLFGDGFACTDGIHHSTPLTCCCHHATATRLLHARYQCRQYSRISRECISTTMGNNKAQVQLQSISGHWHCALIGRGAVSGTTWVHRRLLCPQPVQECGLVKRTMASGTNAMKR